MQQEIVRTLKQIDTDIREFTKCLERATSEKSLDEQGQCEKQLKDLKVAMKAHRSQIRAWTSRFGANLPSKDKLGAARSRIEQELRRCEDLEKSSKYQAASERVSKRLQLCKDSSTLTEDSKSPGLPNAQWCAESEVKIMSEQLCAEDMEEMEMAKEFVCQICFHVVGQTPQLSSCSHLFCGDCIAKWIEVQPGNQSWARRASMGGAVPCPICKEPLQKDTDLHAVSPESDGNSAILWQMLCGVKVMCANHSKCNSDGKCNWIGDYGSYQEHIRSCTNSPLAQYEKKRANTADTLNHELNITVAGDDVKLHDHEAESETTASELSEHVDSESVYGSERAESEGAAESENADLAKRTEELVPSSDQESDPDSSIDFEESAIKSHPCENTSLTGLIAELINLRTKEHCQAQESVEEDHAAETIEFPKTQEARAAPSKLSSDAVPFEPAKATNAIKPKRKKQAVQGAYGCPQIHMQAAAMQYQAAQAQMAQMAYLHRLRSVQMAHYQAAYLQAHMNQMRSAQR